MSPPTHLWGQGLCGSNWLSRTPRGDTMPDLVEAHSPADTALRDCLDAPLTPRGRVAVIPSG